MIIIRSKYLKTFKYLQIKLLVQDCNASKEMIHIK